MTRSKVAALTAMIAVVVAASACKPPATDAAEAAADVYEKAASKVRHDVNEKTDAMKDNAGSIRESLETTGAEGERAIARAGDVIDEEADRNADILEDKADALRAANPK